MKQLAVVIPAYKSEFFEKTLASFCAQTRKDFTLYVGIDASKDDFESIISQYQNKIEIVFRRFDNNLGATDLVGQWHRCIELTRQEPWIWLFSDDDYVDPTCVQSFYDAIEDKQKPLSDIYHFNVKIINSLDHVVSEPKEYPESITAESFYIKKGIAKLDSFVVEYIFSREVFQKVDGFVKFDLAWGSDIATWVKMGNSYGIRTISGPYVYWRQSNINITPNRNYEMVKNKLRIHIENLAWANKFFSSNKIILVNKWILFRYVVFYSNIIHKKDLLYLLNDAVKKEVITKFYEFFILLFYPVIRLAKILKSN